MESTDRQKNTDIILDKPFIRKSNEISEICTNDSINFKNPKEKSKPKKKNKKCAFCKKKLSLINFECKCNKVFCTTHRYPESHNCSCMEEIKKDQIETLRKNNLSCVSKKITKL